MTTLAKTHASVASVSRMPSGCDGDIAIRVWEHGGDVVVYYLRSNGNHSWTFCSVIDPTPSLVFVWDTDSDSSYLHAVRLAEKYGVPLLVIS